MKYFYIVANYEKEYARETEKQIVSFLKERGAVCRTQSEGADSAGSRRTARADVPKETQCLITIGGDGTLIRAARDLAGMNIPILGVNRGHLGYLNQVNRDDALEPVLSMLLEDRHQVEERMMLSGEARRGSQVLMKDVALNEIALSRKSVLKALRFQVYVNGEYLSRYSADGIILSTPTGSTAYNMSAGGPLVAPGARMMIMTPICSHELNARSIVLEPEDEVRIEVYGDGQVAAFDGDTFVELGEGDQLVIRRSAIVTPMIRLKQISFMQNLSNHMSGRI